MIGFPGDSLPVERRIALDRESINDSAYERSMALPEMKTAKTILTLAIIIGIVAFVAMHPDGLLRLLGLEKTATVHSFVTKGPDGTTTQIRVRMLEGEVRLSAERLNDHAKSSLEMSDDDYKAFWNRVKDSVVPGTDQVTNE
jgi:hypothetical protein